MEQKKKTRSDYRADGRVIERRKCSNPKRRKSLEADDEAWLLHYFSEAFPKPFGDVHREMISTARKSFESGGKSVFVAPRGTGKTTLFQALTVKMLLCGQAPFPAYLPWDARGVRKALRFWKNAVCFNKKIADDYPEYVDPFVASKGSSQRCKVLLWSDTKEPTGAELLVSGGMIVFPDMLGVIGSATINGNPRGLNHSTEDGRVWRPSFALIDDAQSKEVAKSPQQIRDTIDIINTDVAGMAGPDSRMAIFLLGTILCKDDVVDIYSNSRDWNSVRVPQITSWPKTMPLWDAFGDLVRDRKEDEALEFYNANAAEMLEGATVSWADRFDRGRGEPNAVYSAMRDFYFMGHSAFMAERQGEPVDAMLSSEYTLTVDQVLSHSVKLPRFSIPAGHNTVVGHCDINKSGLHWCVASFDQQMTAHVVAYGRHPESGDVWSDKVQQFAKQKAIFSALESLFEKLSCTRFSRGGEQVYPSLFLVDGSYETDTVHRFADMAALKRFPFQIHSAIGRGDVGKKGQRLYSIRKDSLVGRAMEKCHFQRPEKRRTKYAMADVSYWREIMQKAFLGVAGEPGGCTLHHVDHKEIHMRFAEHVTAEKLAEKVQSKDGWIYIWKHAVGSNWDWGDALTGCWVAAALTGLTSGGAAEMKKKKQIRAVISGRTEPIKETKKEPGEENGTTEQQQANAGRSNKRRAVIGKRGRW